MAKVKKNLTPTQKLKKCKRISRITAICEIPSVILPFVGIGIANYEQYFVEYNGLKITFAGILTAAVLGFTVWAISSQKIKNTFVILLIKLAIIDAVFFLLGKIITDIAYILLFVLIGLVGSTVLDGVSKKYVDKANKIQSAIDESEKEILKEEYKEEIERAKEEEKKDEVRF